MKIMSVFGKVGRRLFSDKFVNNCKRTIFMTTLYLKFNRVEGATKKDLQDVNDNLGLVKDPSSLAFPATLGESLWKERDFSAAEKEIAKDDMPMACQKIMALTPRWMKYGVDPRQMERDIATVAKSTAGRRALA